MSFDERKKGFEQKFVLDEELRFKANARRAKLMGLWAAEKFGLNHEQSEAYAKSLVVADLEEAGDEDLFRKLRSDFDAHKVAQSDQQIRHEMDEKLAIAIEQVRLA